MFLNHTHDLGSLNNFHAFQYNTVSRLTTWHVITYNLQPESEFCADMDPLDLDLSLHRASISPCVPWGSTCTQGVVIVTLCFLRGPRSAPQPWLERQRQRLAQLPENLPPSSRFSPGAISRAGAGCPLTSTSTWPAGGHSGPPLFVSAMEQGHSKHTTVEGK